MSFPTVTAPVKSPSLAEYGDAQYTDPSSGKVLPLLGVVAANPSTGATGLAAGAVTLTDVSQVTAKANRPQAGAAKIPMVALVGIDPTTGAPIAFAPASAGSAGVVTGKFQSTVQTGTGASQNIAHGLGVVPSLVLAAMVDTNGVALPLSIIEGAHDATNLKLTATTSLKYKVIAFA